MEIEKDYLAQIFDGDELYVFKNEAETPKYEVAEQSSEPDTVKEPQDTLKPKMPSFQPPQKEVLILVNGNLGEAETDTLNKLLKAINVGEEEYEIIQDHPEQLKLIQHLKLFLSFHNQFVQSDEYNILNINKGKAIYVHELAELNKDTSKKVMLWNLLKTIV